MACDENQAGRIYRCQCNYLTRNYYLVGTLWSGPVLLFTCDVPPNAIVVGNPARIKGYSDTRDPSSEPVSKEKTVGKSRDLGVGASRLYDLEMVDDLRGKLVVGEVPDSLPFVPQRCFMVFDVPSKEIRGEHAHRTLQEFLCVRAWFLRGDAG